MRLGEMRRGAVALLLAGIALATLATPSRGREPRDWVGTRVVLKFGAELRDGDRVVDTHEVHCIYTVERASGDRLRVRSGGVAGWVEARDVVPYGQAVEYYTSEIRAHPDAAWAYNRRGLIRDGKGQSDLALADYDEAIRLDPHFALAYTNRGLAWGHKGRFDRAIADYDEAIRLDPSDAVPYVNRGRARARTKEYGKALADLDQAIKVDPGYFNAHNGRAWLLATCPDASYRDGTKAVESATRACELEEWNNAYCLGTLAAAHAEAGHFEEAIAWQEKANRLYETEQDRDKGRARLKLYRAKTPFRMPP
jgi:tetratricopeptide (TPR) repeat protein